MTGAAAIVNFRYGEILAPTSAGGFNRAVPASYSILTLTAGGGNRIQVDGFATSDFQVLGVFTQGGGSDPAFPVTVSTTGFR